MGREFFDELAKELGIDTSKLEQWFEVSAETYLDRGAGTILNHYYNGSLSKAIQALYPEHVFEEEKSSRANWKDKENQKSFLDEVAKLLGVDTSKAEQWHAIKAADIIAKGGKGILYHYGGSLSSALESIYPGYVRPPESDAESGLRKARGHWKDVNNQRTFFDQAAKQLGISSSNPEEWYKVSKEDIIKLGGSGILQYYQNSFTKALATVYKELNFDPKKMASAPKWGKSQWLYFQFMKELLFPSISSRGSSTNSLQKEKEILMDYKHPELVYSDTRKRMELDIFIPSLNLAFEYQGEHHYHSHYLFGSNETQKVRDEEKRMACKRAGITLIEIPYWWDRSKTSIAATIHKYRPDIIPEAGAGQPIPEYPPNMKTPSLK